jgi:transcriptional repressor NrdR
MKCPFCGQLENKVVDSRINQSGDITRRRRECLACQGRFTTYERVEELMPLVIKKDGRLETFEREKILSGLTKACQKRPIKLSELEEIVHELELKIQAMEVKEISSHDIGQMVMSLLKTRDKVAYVRFASVYRDFTDVEEFVSELTKSLNSPSPADPSVNH